MPVNFDEEAEEAHEVIVLGKQIYDERIRELVEPEFLNQYVAIAVDSGDYTVASSTGNATRTLAKAHPEAIGRIFLRKIGDEPDYALIARMMAGEMMARQRK